MVLTSIITSRILIFPLPSISDIYTPIGSNNSKFIIAANKCDALVSPYSGSGNQKIFACNARTWWAMLIGKNRDLLTNFTLYTKKIKTL